MLSTIYYRSGEGVAYITDSSTDGRNGLIVVDLGTGHSWRHLERWGLLTPPKLSNINIDSWLSVTPRHSLNLGSFLRTTVCLSTLHRPPHTGISPRDWTASPSPQVRPPICTIPRRLDISSWSSDGEFVYYCALASRAWYRLRASYLRVPTSGAGATATAAIRANAAVEFLGQRPSNADGLESDSTGTIYLTAPERGSIYTYHPDEGMLKLFVRDTRLQWPVSYRGRVFLRSELRIVRP